jgi:transcriptional regulator with XRE-family HTH domain
MVNIQLATPDELVRELGSRLRAQRLASRITQQELALRAGVALGAIKKLEADGHTTLQTFVRVVQALSLTSDLENVLVLKPHISIAEMERAAAAPRQRARRPAGMAPR